MDTPKMDTPKDEPLVLRTRTISHRGAHDAKAAEPVLENLPDPGPDTVMPVTMPRTGAESMEHPPSNLGPGWQVIGLPSNGKAGYLGALHIRRFGLPDQARLAAARMAKSVELLAVAIGATIDVPVSQLTVEDFNHLLYWHRQYSYPANMPHVVTWTSRYGKANKHNMASTKLKITTLESSPDYEELYARGFDFPRMSALLWEEAQGDALTTEQQQVLAWATQFAGDVDRFDIVARMDNINTITDLSILGEMGRWAKASKHGVAETVKLRCQHFDPNTALADLAGTLDRIGGDLEFTAYDETISNYVRSLIDEMAALRTAELNKTLDKVVAVEDEITIPLDVHMFFPVVD